MMKVIKYFFKDSIKKRTKEVYKQYQQLYKVYFK